MNIKPIVLLFFIGCVRSASLIAQQQNTVSVLQPEEVIAFHFTDGQVNFWLSAEDYISERKNSGIDIYSDDFYKDATSQEKMWLDSIDAGDSPYNTDYRSRYWGSNWSYASGAIAEKSDTLAYDFNLLTTWHSPKSSNGVCKKITLVFEPAGDSKINKVLFFPGNMRTPVDWQKYGRPAKVALRINGKDIAIIHLKDVMACHVFKIPMIALYQENDEITVVFDILSSYPGSEFEETVVSEINFDGIPIL